MFGLLLQPIKNLEQEIEARRFRQDLYYRLSVVPMTVPPLRDRTDDLPVLVKHFVERFHKGSARTPKVIDPSATEVLQLYHWPGNIRELKNIVERLLIMVNRDVILRADVENVLPIPQTAPQPDKVAVPQENRLQTGKSLLEMVDDAEADLIRNALEANSWNIKRTAEELKIERSNFYKKLEKFNIKRPDNL